LSKVVAYIRKYWQVYGSLILGTSFIAIASYSLFAWVPAYFIRLHDYTPGTVGKTFGPIVLVMGTSGLMLGSYLSDRLFGKGRITAHLDVTIAVTALGIIPAALLMNVDEPGTALICMSFLVFTLSLHTGLTPAALQLITPNELRGQITAVYLFVLNLIALGCGPTIVALITDWYYRDTLAVGNSMSITQTAAIFTGSLILFAGRKAYLRRQSEIIPG